MCSVLTAVALRRCCGRKLVTLTISLASSFRTATVTEKNCEQKEATGLYRHLGAVRWFRLEYKFFGLSKLQERQCS